MNYLIAVVAQIHLTLLLNQGQIFNPLFFTDWLRRLRMCPLCLGIWSAILVSLLLGIYNPAKIVAVAGLGYLGFVLENNLFTLLSLITRRLVRD